MGWPLTLCGVTLPFVLSLRCRMAAPGWRLDHRNRERAMTTTRREARMDGVNQVTTQVLISDQPQPLEWWRRVGVM